MISWSVRPSSTRLPYQQCHHPWRGLWTSDGVSECRWCRRCLPAKPIGSANAVQASTPRTSWNAPAGAKRMMGEVAMQPDARAHRGHHVEDGARDPVAGVRAPHDGDDRDRVQRRDEEPVSPAQPRRAREGGHQRTARRLADRAARTSSASAGFSSPASSVSVVGRNEASKRGVDAADAGDTRRRAGPWCSRASAAGGGRGASSGSTPRPAPGCS